MTAKRETALDSVARAAQRRAIARAMAVDEKIAPLWLCKLMTRCVLAEIGQRVQSGERVALPDFGVFFRRELAAREIPDLHPLATALTRQIPATWSMAFRPSKNQKGKL